MTTTKPSQAYLKAYLEQRHKSQTPPPTPSEIRRQLGWDLVKR
jgi:hypothetical protein